MSDNLHNIIKKYFHLLRNDHQQPIYSSLSELAGKILSDLYNSDLNNQLDIVSKVILDAPQCMKHIIKILTRMRSIDLDTAIRESYDEIVGNKIEKEIKQYNTLIDMIESAKIELEKQFVSDKDFENALISSVEDQLRESRLRGILDEDTRLFVTHPNHLDKLRTIYRNHKKGSSLSHLITEEFNILSKNQHILPLIENNFSSSDKEHLFSIEERIKQTVMRQMDAVHANLDHLGESLFSKIEEVRIVQTQYSDSINILIAVINEISELLANRIIREIFPKLIDEVVNVREHIVNVREHIAKDAKELQRRVLGIIKGEIATVIDNIKTELPILSSDIKREIIKKINEKL